MKADIKRRIVGSLVLLALAALILPSLFDGSGQVAHQGAAIPPQPIIEMEPVTAPVQLPQAPFTVDERPQLVEEEVAKEQAVPSQSAAKPSDILMPEVVDEDPAKAAQPDEQSDRGWVIQVASFSEKSKSLHLRDSLRSKGFRAFVETYRKGTTNFYRVRVGPELKRENAEKLLQELQRKAKVKGYIVRND